MANIVGNAGLGLVFWAAASHLYPPAVVGEDAALISAMMLLSIVSQLNLGMGLSRLLPQVSDRRRRPVAAAYGLTAAAGIAVAGAFVLLAPRLSHAFGFLRADRWLALALIGSVLLWSIFALQDAALTAARWAPVVPVENALFGALKIAVMIWLAHRAVEHGVLFGWVVAAFVMVVPVNVLLFAKVLPKRPAAAASEVTALPLAERGRIVRYLAADYGAALCSQGYNALLPVLVLAFLGRTSNAYFYMAFLVTGAVAALAQSLSTSLVVEGAHAESELSRLARSSVVRYAEFVLPPVAALSIGAPVVLRIFGGAYAAHAHTVLRLLLIGTIPLAVVTLYLGVERVRARADRVLAVEGATVLAVVAGSVVSIPRFGLDGLGWTWLATHTAVAAAVAPRLYGVIRPATARARRIRLRVAGERWVLGVDAAAVVVTVCLLLAATFGVRGDLRAVAAFAFVTFVPGWAFLDVVPLDDGAARFALAVAVSLTACIAATLAMLWLRTWQPLSVLYFVAGGSLAAIAWHVASAAAVVPSGGAS
jgi:O-antigen/teichoic acid export membrane protein